MLNLVDWPSIASNALWIFGASLLVATMSYRLFLGNRTTAIERSTWLASCFICLGLVVSRNVLWERLACGVLGCLALLQLARSFVRSRTSAS